MNVESGMAVLAAWAMVAALPAMASWSPDGPPVTARYLGPVEMASRAELTVEGQVTAVGPTVMGSRVYTDIRLSVISVLRGTLDESDIRVHQPGGITPELSTFAGPIPDVQKGEVWILFLARPPQGWWTIYGVNQGAFRVVGDRAERDFSGMVFASPPPETVVDGKESLDAAQVRHIAHEPPQTTVPESSKLQSVPVGKGTGAGLRTGADGEPVIGTPAPRPRAMARVAEAGRTQAAGASAAPGRDASTPAPHRLPRGVLLAGAVALSILAGLLLARVRAKRLVSKWRQQ